MQPYPGVGFSLLRIRRPFITNRASHAGSVTTTLVAAVAPNAVAETIHPKAMPATLTTN
jgi:hypothetical protein